jgi:hypothetical protein
MNAGSNPMHDIWICICTTTSTPAFCKASAFLLSTYVEENIFVFKTHKPTGSVVIVYNAAVVTGDIVFKALRGGANVINQTGASPTKCPSVYKMPTPQAYSFSLLKIGTKWDQLVPNKNSPECIGHTWQPAAGVRWRAKAWQVRPNRLSAVMFDIL